MKLKHEELIALVEVEPSEEETILNLWSDWYEAERQDIKRGVAEYINKRFRQVIGKKQLVERITGEKIRVHQPRTVIKLNQE